MTPPLPRNTVWRLLRRNISAGQLLGYALANLTGLAIVLTALQFYRDVHTVWTDEDPLISRDYVIISKKVDGLNLAGGDPYAFTPAERADIAAQPWAAKVGEFTSAAFNVGASVEMGGRGMSTFLFLESIPDEFFDVKPRDWDSWSPDSPDAVVPIVISKDYLTLYNFGFASSRGLPQISETMIGAVPLRLSLSGNGRQQYLPARIVGFSSRLNTIAVPQQFLDWANGIYADGPLPDPSRLIIESTSPGDPAVAQYLSDHDYESAGDKVDSGRAARFLVVVTSAVVAVGAVISLLAFFILLLSIYLLLQKNRDKIRDLLLLGYTPQCVARHYYTIVVAVNVAVLACSLAVMLIARGLWEAPLSDLGIRGASPWVSIVTGVAAVAVITALNIAAIYRNVRRNF